MDYNSGFMFLLFKKTIELTYKGIFLFLHGPFIILEIAMGQFYI
jgi:hypothetical protein